MQPPAAAAVRDRARLTTAERVELGEEVDERRDEQPRRRAVAGEHGHLRQQVVAAAAGCPRQAGQRARRVSDVGVSEQQILRIARGPNALRHRPHLAGPARRRRAGGHDGQLRPAGAAGEFAGDHSGAIGAVIVDQDHGERTAIALGQQARQTARQHLGLVPGRDDRGHPRQRRLGRSLRRQPLPGPPEAAVQGEQVEPGEGGSRRQDAGDDDGGLRVMARYAAAHLDRHNTDVRIAVFTTRVAGRAQPERLG
jgi:hypothetical protein